MASEPEQPHDDSNASDPGASDDAPTDEISTVDSSTEESTQTDADAPDSDDAPDADTMPTDEKPTRAAELAHPGSALVALLSAALVFLLFAQNQQYRFSVPLGLTLLIASVTGLLDALGTFDRTSNLLDDSGEPDIVPFARVARPLLLVVGSGVALGASLALAQYGTVVPALGGALVFGSYLALIISVFYTGLAIGVFSKDDAPWHKRYGFWLLAFAGALYFPTLGIFSLTDPWETHYGEVAREILARDDWISLWWAQEDWFWSKPILNFWIQALAMSALFTHYQPDGMLIGHGGAPIAHPEWVVRAPNVMLTLIGLYVIYRAVAKVFGKRAGFLGGFVLATSPDWYFLAHQTMTDMPFVAPMTAAMGFLLLGLHTHEDERIRAYGVRVGQRTWYVSGWHLLFFGILLCALPQILYLFSRNLELNLFGAGKHGFLGHFDRFTFGSAGNCGLPGNKACHAAVPATAAKATGPAIVRFVLGAEPAIQALVWSVLLGAVCAWNLSERRRQRIYYLAAWLFAALATMGKGPAGLALPALCTFLYLVSTKRWGELMKLEILSGLLIVLAVALPWYVAMYVRHGSQFTDRLIFHDMWKRALEHVHDTNEGDDTSFRFYVWQLGYALFPWSGLAPLGLLAWMKSTAGKAKSADGATFLFMWFLFAFALFSLMGTKFHHYIFPAVPPLAMLTGVALDELLGYDARRPDPSALVREGLTVALATLAAVSLASAVVFALGGSWLGWVPPPGPRMSLALGFTGLALVSLILASRRVHRTPLSAPGRTLLLGAGAIGSAFAVAAIGRDLSYPARGSEGPGPIRYLQLFTYQYRRPWPDSIDFTAALAGLTVAAAVIGLLIAFAPIRRAATFAMLGLGAFAAFWGEDIYFVKTAQHWGQHEVIEAYYHDRKSPDERLVAYQMNWKGENFYTGNHIPAFVSSGATFADWLKKERANGAKVMYFVTEHSRVGGLRSEVQGRNYVELTTKAICNKFVLVRAEL